MDDSVLEFQGTVVSAIKNKFEVKVSETHSVLCSLGGKIRVNGIRILIGDAVCIETSPYDVKNGRIVYRMKE